MRSRSTITAALALAAVTILAVAACGSSTVSGSAAVNSAAAETLTTSTRTSTSPSTTRTSTETSESTGSTEETTATEPTDLSELLSALPTDLSLPSDFPSDLSLPSDLGGLNIPGYSGECLSVGLAYASILLATYPTLVGGDGAFNSADLQKAISDLSGQIPPEIAPDIQALGEVAAEANGKSLTEVGQLFESDKFTTATKNIENWTNANCGG